MTHTTTKKTNAVVAVAAAVLLLPGLLAACSGSPSGSSSDAPKAGGKPGTSMSECMRDKGYDMPDPDSGSRTETLSVPDGVDEEQWGADLETCLGSEGGAGEGFKPAQAGGSPEQEKQMNECVRKNGFSDYPDDADAKRSYQPEDEAAFNDVTSKCIEETFDAGTKP